MLEIKAMMEIVTSPYKKATAIFRPPHAFLETPYINLFYIFFCPLSTHALLFNGFLILTSRWHQNSHWYFFRNPYKTLQKSLNWFKI